MGKLVLRLEAPLLAAVGHAGLDAMLGRAGAPLELGMQLGEAGLTVEQLRALGTGDNHDVRGEMAHAHSRISRVDALPARA